MRRRLAAMLLMGVMLALLALSALPAFAAPSSNASCVGLGSSSVGQAQTRDEAAHDIKEQAEEEGTTPGAIVSSVARQHLGSEQACFGEGE
jgi:hypothetical protein